MLALYFQIAKTPEVKVFAFEGEGGLTTGASHETMNSAWGLGLGNLIYFLDWPAWVAAALYIIDHLFYAMMIAQKTYLQKIALKKDLASTTAVAFTINHIAAVFLPVVLGYVWIISPPLVFILATFLALLSLLISFMVPENPFPGNETIFSKT